MGSAESRESELSPEHASTATTPRAPRGWALALLVAAVAGGGAVWPAALGVAGLEVSDRVVQLERSLVGAAVLALGSALVLRAARTRLDGRERWCWSVIGVGAASAALGNVAWGAQVWAGDGANRNPVLLAVTLAVTVTVLVGAASLPSRHAGSDRGRLLDTSLVLVSSFALAWAFPVTALAQRLGGPDGLGRTDDAMLAVTAAVNLVVLLVASSILVRCRPDRRGEIVPMVTALVLSSGSELLVSLDPSASNPALASGIHVLQLCAATLLVVVGWRLLGPEVAPTAASARHRRRPALPEVATLVALLALAARELTSTGSTAANLVLGTALILIAAARLAQIQRDQGELTDSLRRAADRLRHQARTDSLTGLGNRTALGERLELAVRRADHADDDAVVLVCFVDVDGFKGINDALGHHVGDRVLVELAHRLRSVLGQDVFRLGGDEFVAFRELVPAAQVAQLADQLLRAAARPVTVDGIEVDLGISIGIDLRTPDRDPSTPAAPADLLRRADLALYRAKQLGGTRWCVYDDSLQESAAARADLRTEFRIAVESGLVTLRYRPVADLSTGVTVGAQAHLRWASEGGDRILSAEVLAAALESGVAVEMAIACFDDLRRALREAATVRGPATPDGIWVGVQIDATMLSHPGMVALIEHTLTTSSVEPWRLHIEVDESTVVDPTAAAALVAVRELGAHLTVTGFGAGPSSMLRLDGYPAATIKLDPSFVAGLGRRRDDTVIVDTVGDLARELDIELAADGITDEYQVTLLRRIGATLGQGPLIGGVLDRRVFFDRLHSEHAPSRLPGRTSAIGPSEQPTPMASPGAPR